IGVSLPRVLRVRVLRIGVSLPGLAQRNFVEILYLFGGQSPIADRELVDHAGEATAPRLSDHGIPRLGRLGGAADSDLAYGGAVDLAAHHAGRRVVGKRHLMPYAIIDVEPFRPDDATFADTVLEQVEGQLAIGGDVDMQA